MQLGFVIDQEKCIGCHACTVACKAENDVPLGQFRTWVKYTERGQFPEVTRDFLVQRCNHCSDAPCVTICPVHALKKREDGIVDVDRDACIGCRACMQACPYDALYLNHDRGSVEKCHFCAHRVEVGLEPACAVVCPVNAIIAGDLDSPDNQAGAIVRDQETAVRRPEQGTGPNVHYIGAEPVALRPGAAARPSTYIWSDRPQRKPEPWPEQLPLEPDVRVVLDTDHDVEWGWPVAAYLLTKGVAAGVAMLAPFSLISRESNAPELIALLFTAVTCLLLVGDLTRPWAFFRMITHGNWSSWLVKGAAVLSGFVGLVAASLLLRVVGADGAAQGFRWAAAVAGLAVAGYTAFLFAQCKGRDLWESRRLLHHLLIQAILCGSAAFLVLAPGTWSLLPADNIALRVIFTVAALGHCWLAILERTQAHPTENATAAAAFLDVIRVGPLRAYRDGLLIGVAAAILLAFLWPALVFVPAFLGLLLYEHAYVRAGQLPPLS